MFLSKLAFYILLVINRWTALKYAKVFLLWGLKSRIFLPNRQDSLLTTQLFGKTFKTPLGLASDFDYTGEFFDLLIPLGLSFGELGSYTLNPISNPVSMTFLQHDKSVLVCSEEINNPGIQRAVNILAKRRHLSNFIGVSLGSFNKVEIDVSKGRSVYTYLGEFREMAYQVAPYVDYIVINLSHPDMILCRSVSDKSIILPLIQTVQEAARISAPISTPKVLVKLPHNLSDTDVKSITDILLYVQVDGVIVAGPAELSEKRNQKFDASSDNIIVLGAPLHVSMINLIKRFYIESQGKLCLIASGGVQTGMDAYEAIAAGASGVQICSTLLIDGPEVIYKINRELTVLMKQNQINSINELIGSKVVLNG